MARTRARGFTLIELMVVVTIIGVLASVAIPNFQKLALRAKMTERATLMLRVRQAVEDYFRRTGSATPPLTGFVASEWNPPFPPSSAKKMPLTSLASWNIYFSGPNGGSSVQSEMEGPLYYSYMFLVQESPGISTLSVIAAGDLDGDGLISFKTISWRRQEGVYQWTGETPPAGFEDDAACPTYALSCTF